MILEFGLYGLGFHLSIFIQMMAVDARVHVWILGLNVEVLVWIVVVDVVCRVRVVKYSSFLEFWSCFR